MEFIGLASYSKKTVAVTLFFGLACFVSAQDKDGEEKKEIPITRKTPHDKHTAAYKKSISTYMVSWQGFATNLPTSSVLHMPNHLSERFSTVASGKLLSFPEFLKKNKSWITAYELEPAQIMGKERLNFELLEGLKKNGTVLITTHEGHPMGLGAEVLKFVTTPEPE